MHQVQKLPHLHKDEKPLPSGQNKKAPYIWLVVTLLDVGRVSYLVVGVNGKQGFTARLIRVLLVSAGLIR